MDMILTEVDALERVCVPLSPKTVRHQLSSLIKCVGSQCLAYWRWNDDQHVYGYCNINGKPER